MVVICAGSIISSMMCIVFNFVLGSKPHTMSVKWQKATDEYMKFHKMNPIFGMFRSSNLTFYI